MSESIKIPQLNLFSSYRNHKSPTRDYHQRSPKTTKNNKTLNENYVSRQFIPRISEYPPPIYNPIVPLPQVCPPIIRRPIPELYPGISHEFIRAPSTYLQYAEDYLLGYPLSIIPSSTTGRFYNSKPLSQQIKKQQTKCMCQQNQHHENLSKNVYIKNNKNQDQNKMKQNLRPETQINIHPPAKNEKQGNISKDPYINLNTKRQQKNQKREGQKGLSVIEQSKSLVIEQPKKQGIRKKDESIQTDQINNKSVTTIRRSQMETLDNQSFIRIQQTNFETFNQIKIQLEDAIEYDPEIQDLNQIKQVYELEGAHKISELDRILERGRKIKTRTTLFRGLC